MAEIREEYISKYQLNFQMVINRQSLPSTEAKYERQVLKSEAIVVNRQFDSAMPTFVNAHVRQDEVVDEVMLAHVNTGQNLRKYLYSMDIGNLQPSAQRDYKNGKYRFFGF